MDSIRVYLIVDGGGNARLAKRRPTLDWDEVAFPITVQIPPGWGRVYDSHALTLTVPAPPEIEPPTVGPPESPPESEPESEP